MSAFEELVFRYERRIYAFVLQLCSNPADAAEITQDTFVKAFRNIVQFNPRHAFAGWLFTIARHQGIDHHRAALPVSDTAPADEPDLADPAALLASHEDRANLWSLARRVLPAAQFQAIWLTYAEGMQAKEVARVMNRTATHVKVMLFRARRTLRGALEDSGQDLIAREIPGKPAAFRGMKSWAFSAVPARPGTGSRLRPIPET